MNHGKISIRYARALYDYAVEQKEDQAVYTDMQSLAGAVAEVKGLKTFLANPAVDRQDDHLRHVPHALRADAAGGGLLVAAAARLHAADDAVIAGLLLGKA